MKRYPTYKPSGVDWLGEIPAEFDIWSSLVRTNGKTVYFCISLEGLMPR
ncbi:MAG: hypothetical protein ABIF11_04905 [Nitrospirota bacterium]